MEEYYRLLFGHHLSPANGATVLVTKGPEYRPRLFPCARIMPHAGACRMSVAEPMARAASNTA
jgi:hypothetical protein